MLVNDHQSYIYQQKLLAQLKIKIQVCPEKSAKTLLGTYLGDRVVMRPVTDDPVASLEGRYAGRGPNTDVSRRREREQDARRTRTR